MIPPSRPVPDALLERYLLDELPAAKRAELDALLRGDATLRRRLEALRGSDADILARYPSLPGRAGAGRAGAAPGRPAAPPRRPAPRLRLAGPAFATLALLAAAFLAYPPGPPSREGADGIRLKGSEASLVIYRKTRSGAELLPPRGTARAGDTLQIFYQVRGPAHGAVFSVDGNDKVTLHLPEEEGPAALLEGGGLRALPHAYLLDRAPRLERFYLVTAPDPFAVARVLDGLRARLRGGGGAPDSLAGLPPGFRQQTYTLQKDGAAPGRVSAGRRP